MKFIDYIYNRLLSIFNYPYIPKEILKDLEGPILLHISDTPSDIYKYIFRIVDIIKPQFIIHTGDLADNIKLEIYRDKLDYYNEKVAELIKGLEKYDGTEIYYVLGNHDEYETVKNLSKRGNILNEGIITIENCNFFVGHYYKEYSCKVDFSLYGHSFSPAHHIDKNTIGLNGVLNINIIDLSTRKIYQLDYPIGTNRLRLMEMKRVSL